MTLKHIQAWALVALFAVLMAGAFFIASAAWALVSAAAAELSAVLG